MSKQRHVLDSQTRETVIKVRDYFEREKQNNGPIIPVQNVVERTAAAMQISERTVMRICKEKRCLTGTDDILSTPNKKRKNNCPITSLDSVQEDSIRNHIYGYYQRKEYPTRSRLLQSLKEAELFHGGRTSLSRVMKSLGFTWKKSKNSSQSKSDYRPGKKI